MATGSNGLLFRRLVAAAALGFMGFLIWIVIIADRGEGTPWWAFIYRIPFGDKVGHLGLTGTLSFLCNLAFPSRKPLGPAWAATRTSLILLGVVTAEELSQAFIATRQLDVLDWLADLAGIAGGQVAAWWIITRTGRIGSRADTAL